MNQVRDVLLIDHFYVDLNGVIHIVSHNNSFEKMISDRTYDDIIYDVLTYVDQMVHMVKPEKSIVIAFDGVAPRAKMNQQRSRRMKKTQIDVDRQNTLKLHGKTEKDIFNSDCISVGTEFMHCLKEAIDTFIAYKLESDPIWRKVRN